MTNPQSVSIPRFVLLNGKDRIGPKLSALPTGPERMAIYGFSEKKLYDAFCARSELALTPYPLVKGYLQNQVAELGDTVRLVIVDATGPQEAQVNAATMDSILDAQQAQATRVNVSFQLTLDTNNDSYLESNVLVSDSVNSLKE